jgi:HEAT repeat protein
MKDDMLHRLRIALVLLTLPVLALAEPDVLGKRESLWLADLDKDAPARRAAVFALGKLGIDAGQRVIPALTKRLTDADAAVRAGAARAIGEIVEQLGQGAAPYWDVSGAALIKAAGDPEARVRRAACVALGGFGTAAAPAVETLRKGLADPEAEVRQNAAWALGNVGVLEGDTAAELCERLRDEDALVRRDTVGALAALYQFEANRPKMKEVGPAMGRLLREEITPEGKPRDVVVLSTALEKLVTFGPLTLDNLGKTLTPILNGEDEELARLAAMTLASVGGKDAQLGLPVLVRGLKAPDPTMQELAAASLAQLGPLAEPVWKDLAEAIRPDRAPRVRRNAAIAIGRLGPKGRPALNHLIESIKLDAKTPEEKTVRTFVVEAVAQIGYPNNLEALPALAELIRTETDSAIRLRAVWSFLGCENLPPEGEKALTALLEEPAGTDPNGARPEAARVLAAALKARAPLKVIEVLHEGLISQATFRFEGSGTRVNAGNEQGSGTSTTQASQDPDARYLYARALGMVGPGVRKSPLSEKVKADLEAARVEKNRPKLNDEATKALRAIGF